MTWVPGRTAGVGTTGVADDVQPHTMSAVATRSGRAATTVRPLASTEAAKASDAAGVRPETSTVSMSGRTHSMASTWPRAWAPVPKIPRAVASGRARASVATAEAAGVRSEVRAVPSRVATGAPVVPSHSR